MVFLKETYGSTAHCKHRLRYHVIFSTKYRRKCLDEIRDEVIEAFKYAESISNFKILVMELDKDHIHLLMKWKPSLSIDQVVRRLKQITTNQLWKTCPSHLSKFFWNKKIIWTGGYFCSTIGSVSEETLKRYIENQG